MMNARQRFCIAALLAVSTTFAGPTSAGTIVIPSFDRGHVHDDGRHQATNDNYIIEDRKSGSWSKGRNFFVFDISGLTAEALEATFRVYNPPAGFDSPDAFETLELNPINKVPLTAFFADDPGTGAFLDLGDGTPYGSANIQRTDLDVFIDIPLNAAALFDINLRIINSFPYFGLGGELTTADSGNPAEELVFASSGSGNPSDGGSVLILTGPKIPEPTTLVMLSTLSVMGLIVSRRRRRTA